MSILLNTNTKREYIVIPIIPIGEGIPLHLKQNNITYHSTGKNTTEIIFTITQTQKKNKTIYHSTNK